jgi:5-amino-6-(5-phosphoribosylamino)uracil reductase
MGLLVRVRDVVVHRHVIDHPSQPATSRFGAVRRLWPEAGNVDDVGALVADEARPAHPDRPWLLVNMVASLDGAITIDERSGGLGGEADRAMFFALRHVADVILVGAGTARAEDYGPARATDEVRRTRRERGQAEVPRLALVTRSLDLAPDARVFADPINRPYVITHEGASAERVAALSEVADVVQLGATEVDLVAAVQRLHADGASVITCEGGPTLNGDLIAHDLIDEWCLTVAPLLVAGDAGRGSRGPLPDARRYVLARLLEADGDLLGRWVRDRA